MSRTKSTDKDELKQLLGSAKHEIIDLRRKNEILSAKVEVMELFACVLHTRPAQNSHGAAEDVAWLLQRQIDNLDAEVDADA